MALTSSHPSNFYKTYFSYPFHLNLLVRIQEYLFFFFEKRSYVAPSGIYPYFRGKTTEI